MYIRLRRVPSCFFWYRLCTTHVQLNLKTHTQVYLLMIVFLRETPIKL